MGKTKSAVCLTLITLVIAVLIVVCFISFPCGSIHYYNSIISLTSKDADLGGYLIGETSYVGGGYAVVYYPEGVISSREYQETASGKTGDELTEYEDSYVSYANGAIYLEKEIVCEDGTEEISEEFIENFENVVSSIRTRYEALQIDGTSVQICDGYSIRVFLPSTSESAAAAFQYLSYTGEFSMSFGDDEDSAAVILPSQKGTKHSVDYYVKSAGTRSSNGSYYVTITFTDEGQEAIADATEEDTGTIYFYVGDNLVLSLTVSEQIDQKKLYISSDDYTKESATIVASLFDDAIKNGTEDDPALSMDELLRVEAGFGNSALTLIYIALGVCIAASAAYFFIRYRRLGFAHLYSFLVFAIAMTLCVWAISSLYIGVGTILAFVLTAIMLCVSNAYCYESAKKEYANGKTLAYSVKSGYKKCLWNILDAHIVVALIGFLLAPIGLTELSAFGLTLGLGAVFSGVCSQLLGRFFWYIMMPFAKDQAKFCHFKRGMEVDEDE